MRHKVQAKFPGMIPATQYAGKYDVHHGTVRDWVKSGRLNGLQDGIWWHVEDVPPPKPKKGDHIRKGEKFCGACELWHPLESYSPSRRTDGGYCRECCAQNQRIRNGHGSSPEAISYRQEVIARREVAEAVAMGRSRERRRRVMEHAKRIAAMGLAGDGADWDTPRPERVVSEHDLPRANAKMTYGDIAKAARMSKNGQSFRAIARHFGVSHTVISRVVNNYNKTT